MLFVQKEIKEKSADEANIGKFKMEWLTYLAVDFGISADWLLTGRGEKFVKQVRVEEKVEKNVLVEAS